MGYPFLGDYETPEDRLDAIAREVEAYLLDPENNELPDSLVWLYRIRRWGLPNAGGFNDQPYYFIRDMEAAELGERRAQKVMEANRRLRQAWEAARGG